MLPERKIINVGAQPNDGTGDPLRDASIKTNQNFQALFDGYEENHDDAVAAQESAAQADFSRDAAEQEADRAEAGALAALLAVADGVYDNDVAAGMASVKNDGTEGFYNVSAEGYLDLIKNDAGTAKTVTRLSTRRSMRSNGINLWEVATKGESTLASDMAETTAAINSVMEDASRWGVGVINCGGREKVYYCGGEYVSLGTLDLRAKDGNRTIPFRRGRLRIRSNIELRGNSFASRARFIAAPGDRDPGPLFYAPFWEGDEQLRDFVTRWIEVDANRANQTYSQYAANTPDANQWIQGHGLTAASLIRFMSYECTWRGWWGHAWFGFNAGETSAISEDWRFIRNIVSDCMQGGGQLDMSRVYSQENHFSGFGGWTALGLNIETTSGKNKLLDITSVEDTFDGRGSYNTPLATIRDWNGVPGVDTDSAAAVARRVSMRRGMYLSGDYYSQDAFTGQRSRVRIIRPKALQATIGGGGFDGIYVENPVLECSYDDTTGIWPPVGEPIHFAYDYQRKGFRECVIRDAQMRCDVAGPQIKVGNYTKVDISAQMTGGRNAGVRSELCGGRIKVHATNIGRKTDRAYWKGVFPGITDKEADAQIGSTSAAVVAFGTQGPLEVDVIATDDRGANAQMQYAAYLNVGADMVTGVIGSSTGHLIAPLYDVNDSVFNRGLIGQDTRSYVQRGPVTINGPLTVKDSIKVDAGNGAAEISLLSGKDQPVRLSMFREGGLEGQLVVLPDGFMQMQIHEKGAFVGAPIGGANDGTMYFVASWQNPAKERETGVYLWTTSAGVWRTSPTKPTAENSGTVIGTQA